jgi:predicted nucleic-acid-binding protein
MRAVDTNLLVRLITGDDAGQAAAAEAFVRPGAWVSHLVLAETVWVLDSVYGLEPDRLAEAVELLLNHQDLTIQDADVVTLALGRYQDHPRLGFSDCLVLEVARRAGHLPLGTLDRNLAKLEGAERVGR